MFRYLLLLLAALAWPSVAHAEPAAFFKDHCVSCHDADSKKGGLDLTALKDDPANPENFARWVKIHDRIEAGEMPPRREPRPADAEKAAILAALRDKLVKAEQARQAGEGRRPSGG